MGRLKPTGADGQAVNLDLKCPSAIDCRKFHGALEQEIWPGLVSVDAFCLGGITCIKIAVTFKPRILDLDARKARRHAWSCPEHLLGTLHRLAVALVEDDQQVRQGTRRRHPW